MSTSTYSVEPHLSQTVPAPPISLAMSGILMLGILVGWWWPANFVGHFEFVARFVARHKTSQINDLKLFGPRGPAKI